MPVVLIGLFWFGTLAYADDTKAAGDALFPSVQIDAGGSLRLRYEWKQGFALGKPGAVDPQDYWLSQLRVHLKAHRGDDWKILIEGQDARLHSAFLRNTVNDVRTPNIFTDRLDLHRGWLQLGWGASRGFGLGAGHLRIGRQKFDFGRLRMIASLEWVNTARVWDGVRLTQFLDGEKRKVDVFASKLVPVRPRALNTHSRTGNRLMDSQFHGVYLTDRASFPDSALELYALLRRNSHAGDEVWTWGLRHEYRGKAWDSELEAMLQTGRYDFRRHRAWALHAGGGRTFEVGWPGEWHAGVAWNFGSGGDGAGGTHKTFDNLYPLNHAYYGYMDLFALQNLHNPEIVLRWKPNGRHTWRLALEGFWLHRPGTDAWYNAGAGVVRPGRPGAPSRVGSEVDITLASRFPEWRLTTLLGFGHFFAGPFVRATGTSSDANFLFAQARYRF